MTRLSIHKTLCLMAIGLMITSANAVEKGMQYREIITLNDGSVIEGFISKDDLTTGEVEITPDWATTSVARADVELFREELSPARLDPQMKEWLRARYEELPSRCIIASITMTGDDCNPEYLIYDQLLSRDADSFDKLLLEDGDILTYLDPNPGLVRVSWKDVARVDRKGVSPNIIEEITTPDGSIVEGYIESQLLRHHRVVKTREGKRTTLLPNNITSIRKKAKDGMSVLEESPIIETLILEEKAGGGKLEGTILENNRKDKKFIILVTDGISKEVPYRDVKAIHYDRK